MKSLYELKPQFQAFLRPYARSMAQIGITPNFVTLSALVLSILSGMLVAVFPEATMPLLLMAAALLLRMALNAIDGILAREHGSETPGGRLLNEIVDVAGDLFMYLPLLLVPEFSPLLLSLVVIASVLVEVAGIAAVSIGADRRHDGPLGKSDRALGFGLLALLSGLGLASAFLINLVLALMVGLGFLTIVNRVNAALEQQAAIEEAKTSPASSAETP